MSNASPSTLFFLLGVQHLPYRKAGFFLFAQENLENIYDMWGSVLWGFLQELFQREITQEDFLA